MEITRKILNEKSVYGGCTWDFALTFDEAAKMPLQRPKYGTCMSNCWAYVWNSGKYGKSYKNLIDEYNADHVYLSVAIRTLDYLEYVQRYIDELIELFSVHFKVAYIPDSVPVFYKQPTRCNRYNRGFSYRDNSRKKFSHYDGRCVIKMICDKNEGQHMYHAFLTYVRHVWESIHLFPVMNEPPSMRDVWINVAKVKPTSTTWSGKGHSNFTGSSSASRRLDMTYESYIDTKIDVIKSKLWPDEENIEYYNTACPRGTPNVKLKLFDAIIKRFTELKGEPLEDGEYDFWEDDNDEV